VPTIEPEKDTVNRTNFEQNPLPHTTLNRRRDGNKSLLLSINLFMQSKDNTLVVFFFFFLLIVFTPKSSILNSGNDFMKHEMCCSSSNSYFLKLFIAEYFMAIFTYKLLI